jgi:hypothetical protein
MTDATATTAPTASIGRVAFWLLAPGYLLALAAFGISMASQFVEIDRVPVNGGPDFSSNWVNLPMNLVIAFIFGGSVAINAILLLRRPSSLLRRELPRRIAVAQLTLYALIVVWIAETLFFFAPNDYQEFDEGIFIVPGVGIAGVSVFVFVLAVRRRNEVFVPRRESAALTARGLALAVSFCVAAIAVSVLASLQPQFGLEDNPIPNVALSTANFALGTPWWMPTTIIGLITTRLGASSAVTELFQVAPVAINFGLVVAALVSTRFRTWFVNWFFRLGKPLKG